MANKLYQMTPKEIVGELDKYIIGQDEAKKSVAIALRNRYRRLLQSEMDRIDDSTNDILAEFEKEFIGQPKVEEPPAVKAPFDSRPDDRGSIPRNDAKQDLSKTIVNIRK